MARSSDQVAPSIALGGKVIHAALSALRERGGEMPANEVIAEVERRVQLTDWDKVIYKSNGLSRWESLVHFFSIDCVKTGYLIKKKSIWYLTPEGEQALNLDPIELIRTANRGYRKWREANPKETAIKPHSDSTEQELEEESVEQSAEYSLEAIESEAIKIIKSYILSKNAYEFQDLCAALLRGMGYYTPFVAPKGKDGGIDVIAYRDPLGTTTPRIKVQVKHKPNTPSGSKDIRELLGVLQKDGDVGIFVASGGFSSDAKQTTSSSSIHVELIDLDRFITLWEEFYSKLTDEDKRLLPLNPVYVLSIDE